MLSLTACTQVPHAEFAEPKVVPETTSPPPILFSKLRLDIPVGTEIGTLTDQSIAGISLIGIPANRRLLQNSINNKELNRVFNDALEGQGYDVVRHLDLTFEEEIENEYLRTEYRVSGKVIDAKINAYNYGRAVLDTFEFGNSGYSGTLYMKIEWSVFDALQRKTIYKTVTEGRGKQRYSNPDGLTLMVNAAFEMAAHNLGANEEFYDLFARGIKPPDWRKNDKRDKRVLQYESDEEVELSPQALSRTPFLKQTQKAQQSSVLVQAGAGHGSGFFITKDGHILTNQHVVGNAQRVRIVTSGKTEELTAQVLRVDHQRDVALLKLETVPETLNIEVMPLRLDWPSVGEDIYAIGAPKNTRLQDSVTNGIVSAHRKGYKVLGTKQDFIQGDITIQSGNSGGPLFDAQGNVIGLSVIGLFIDQSGVSSDLNLFIPIESALQAVNIKY